MTRQPDRYDSFSALQEHEVEGVDYRIRIEDRLSPVTIIVPHGGFIEPATSEVAFEIAAESFSFYCFEGLAADRSHHDLHITSAHFDEPMALGLVSGSQIVVAIHGRLDRGDPETSWVGGLDTALRDPIVQSLRESGFAAIARARGEALAGTAAGNICNRGRRRAGVQLEIPRSVRDALMTDAEQLEQYAGAIRHAIEEFDRAFLSG
jgi:phage replication-related protein YjqB (UPF0714/DUF867 family)